MIKIEASTRLIAANKPTLPTAVVIAHADDFWKAAQSAFPSGERKEANSRTLAETVHKTAQTYLKLATEFGKLKTPTNLKSYDALTDFADKVAKELPSANAPWKNLAGSKRILKVYPAYGKLTTEIRAGLYAMDDYCKELRYEPRHLLDE